MPSKIVITLEASDDLTDIVLDELAEFIEEMWGGGVAIVDSRIEENGKQ